jgi:hypothetical protein
MSANKIARWITTTIPGQITPTMRATLRAGKAGTGQELGSTQYWPDSHKSADAADDICAAIEERARTNGYTILPEED